MINKIEVAEYLDGIGFLINDVEIAFYSSITKRLQIPNTAWQAYKMDFLTGYGNIEIPIEDMKFIMEEVNNYIELKGDKNEQV